MHFIIYDMVSGMEYNSETLTEWRCDIPTLSNRFSIFLGCQQHTDYVYRCTTVHVLCQPQYHYQNAPTQVQYVWYCSTRTFCFSTTTCTVYTYLSFLLSTSTLSQRSIVLCLVYSTGKNLCAGKPSGIYLLATEKLLSKKFLSISTLFVQ
jgi:hypothetical protein